MSHANKLTILVLALAALLPPSAMAWTRGPLRTDTEVVEQADSIVVARVAKGSIKKTLREGGASYEHRATLILSRVIKGKFHSKRLPIFIPYGLLPVSARYEKDINRGDIVRRAPPERPGESVRIYEDNPDEGCFRPTGDVLRKQIWFLNKSRLDSAAPDVLSIRDTAAIQPLSKEPQVLRSLHPH